VEGNKIEELILIAASLFRCEHREKVFHAAIAKVQREKQKNRLVESLRRFCSLRTLWETIFVT
jgi:hypothetical protein